MYIIKLSRIKIIYNKRNVLFIPILEWFLRDKFMLCLQVEIENSKIVLRLFQTINEVKVKLVY